MWLKAEESRDPGIAFDPQAEQIQQGDKPLVQLLALKETRREAASTPTEEFSRVLEITALIPRCLEVAEPEAAARRVNGAYVGVVVGCKALQLTRIP